MKTKLLLYCTKNKWRLFFDKVKQIFSLGKIKSNNDLNGKIVAECDYEVEEIELPNSNSDFSYILSMQDKIQEVYSNSCLTTEQLFDYVKGRNEFYSIHIKNLHIFDKPKELSDFTTRKKTKTYETMACDSCVENIDCKQCPYNYEYQEVMKAPQNMMKVCEWDLKDYILISIQPQWMCKILNRIKTVEVRRVVLKEMI